MAVLFARPMPTPLHPVRQAVSIGLRAALRIRVPGLILLAFALAVGLAYYHIPAFTALCDRLGDLKQQYGYAFSIPFQAFMCGLIPWLIRMILPGLTPRYPLADLLFGVLLWGLHGLLIDTLYTVQAMVFGTEPTVLVVVAKTLCDQLIYTPLLAAPLNAVTHYWKDGGFTRARWREATSKGWYVRIALPNYVSSLALWMPGVLIVYSLPASLQLPMAGIIGCFFALLCSFIAAYSRKDEP